MLPGEEGEGGRGGLGMPPNIMKLVFNTETNYTLMTV